MCISRSSGAGGEQVGRLVADRLGFVYVDEEPTHYDLVVNTDVLSFDRAAALVAAAASD